MITFDHNVAVVHPLVVFHDNLFLFSQELFQQKQFLSFFAGAGFDQVNKVCW